MGSNKKKPIIEGYLKKKKQGSSFKLFSKTNKRWFALDITSATFTYSNNKKVIPLRDIEALSTNDVELEGKHKEPKDWEHYFKLITKERTFELYAQTKAEKEMWVHAFNTILKYKRATKGQNQGGEEDEEDKYDRNSGEGTSEEDPDLRDDGEGEDEEDEDYMEDNGKINLRSRKNDDGYKNHQSHQNSRPKGKPTHQQSDESEEDEGEEYENEPTQKQYAQPSKSQSKPKSKQNKNDKIREEKKKSKNSHPHQEYQEIELPKAQPLRKKRRDDPEEIIEDDLLDSEDEQEQQQQHHSGKENKKVKGTHYPKSNDNNDKDGSDVDIDLDIDKIIRKGTMETIKLDPPSPPRTKDKKKAEEPTYFTGFNHVNNPNAGMAHLKQKQVDKPKPVIKAKTITKKPDGTNVDLLSLWEKKYGKSKPEGAKWDGERVEQSTEHGSEAFEDTKPKPAKKKQKKQKDQKPVYVENVLASQPKIKSDEFEDDWDDDEDNDNVLGNYANVNNYRHPDIPEPETKTKKKGKKKGKKKKNKPLDMGAVQATPNDEGFDMNWDDDE